MAVVNCGLPDCHLHPRHPPQQQRKQPQPQQQPPQLRQLRQPLQLPLRQQPPQRPRRRKQEGKTGLTTPMTSIGKNVWCSNGICPIAFGCPRSYFEVFLLPFALCKDGSRQLLYVKEDHNGSTLQNKTHYAVFVSHDPRRDRAA